VVRTADRQAPWRTAKRNGGFTLAVRPQDLHRLIARDVDAIFRSHGDGVDLLQRHGQLGSLPEVDQVGIDHELLVSSSR